MSVLALECSVSSGIWEAVLEDKKAPAVGQKVSMSFRMHMRLSKVAGVQYGCSGSGVSELRNTSLIFYCTD